MSPRVQLFLLALHIFGGVLWIGGLTATTMILNQRAAIAAREAKDALAQVARRLAMVMELGITFVMVFGLYYLIKFQLYKQPYMHIKLTLVAVLLGMHGLVRARLKKASNGEEGRPPGFVAPLVVLLLLGVIALCILKVPLKS